MSASDLTLDDIGLPIATCSRCGGCGHYSYNTRDGSRCYGCNGGGTQWTAASKKQFALLTADRTAANSVLAVDVKIGDVLRLGSRNWFTVVAIRESDTQIQFDGAKRSAGFHKTSTVELRRPFDIKPYVAAAVATEIKKIARAEAKANKGGSK